MDCTRSHIFNTFIFILICIITLLIIKVKIIIMEVNKDKYSVEDILTE